MGMTIDEHIKRMGDIRNNYDRWSVLGLTPNEAKAFDFAVDTMRKYQKIQEIMDELNGDFYGSYLKDRETLEKIWEVIEDGEVN